MRNDHRRVLLDIFSAALIAVNGRRRVFDFLKAQPPAPVYLISMGKAACAMALGAQDALGVAIQGGLVITKKGHAEALPWPVMEAGHPVPDAASLEAGNRLIEFIREIPSATQVLVLISGGASALVEVLPPGVTLEHLQRLNAWLLASGRDIAAANRLRKRLSLIKGGRLAQRLAPRSVVCLALSDVPGDDPRFIGSGSLVADATVREEPLDDAPSDIRAILSGLPPLPKPDDPCFRNVRFNIVARLPDALAAAAEAARSFGLRPVVEPEFLAGDAVTTGARLGRALIESPAGTLRIWGGETTVRLPPDPGRGGRNQSLALSVALAIQGHSDVLLLAAGTDGTDGPTTDAGALVDGATVERGIDAGDDAAVALTRADAGRFLEASGDLIQTGPTGTNVMDLVLGLHH